MIQWAVCVLAVAVAGGETTAPFPPELVAFTPYAHNPVFEAEGPGHWDEMIRERGWIMQEDGVYHLWYTGYSGGSAGVKKLGYATSTDGLKWTRYPDNPIYSEQWVEDVMVVKHDGVYYMFAEGVNDRAHLLTSSDRIHWKARGTLDIRRKDGTPLPPGPFGTPAALYENGLWYLFYERDDEAIWLATSKDLNVWTNLQDEPVIEKGPAPYDHVMIALNQVFQYKGWYYAYYHATSDAKQPMLWTMNVAASPDLIHWQKYAGNPIIAADNSSGIMVPAGGQLRLYCMHRAVTVFMPK